MAWKRSPCVGGGTRGRDGQLRRSLTEARARSYVERMSSSDTPPSDHFDGQRFFNPGVDTDKSLADLWRWQRLRQRVQWPAAVANPPAPPPPTHVAAGTAAFTFIGHSTYLIQVGGFRLITDPVFSDRASPFSFAGPKRVRPPGLALDPGAIGRDRPQIAFDLAHAVCLVTWTSSVDIFSMSALHHDCRLSLCHGQYLCFYCGSDRFSCRCLVVYPCKRLYRCRL